MKQPPSIDYPAAHSMDTTWFAVDRDGHVAAFESYEGGAVPNDALSDQNYDPVPEVSNRVSECDIIFTLEDRQSPLNQNLLHAPPQKPFKRRPSQPNPLKALWLKFTGATASPPNPNPSTEVEELIAPVFMFLTDLAGVEDALNLGLCVRVKSMKGKAVLFQHLPIDLYQSLHNCGRCTGCFYLFGYETEDSAYTWYSKFGLYHYACCESQMAAPYGRVSVPDQPLNLKDLPVELQEQFAKLQFNDLSFSKTPYLQPAERAESYTWDGGYLTEDWKTFRPNPGQEKQYEEFYKEIAAHALHDDFDYQPPAG